MINLNQRACGILLPLFSLPSDYGIGTLGISAYRFVDFLSESGQTYWQILPIPPTPNHNSPYTAFSAFAGNDLFIDLDLLVKDKYLNKTDVNGFDYGTNLSRVNYKKVRSARAQIYKKLFENFINNIPKDFQIFCQNEQFWLDDYALFMSISNYLKSKELIEWPEEYKLRNKKTINHFHNKYKNKILYYKMLQYFFFKQWNNLHSYATKKGIFIIGDIPFYISLNSADAWCQPKNFMLDEKLIPLEVAGCPPDLFSKDGQLWGNPVYDWKYLKNTKYDWWIQRLKQSFKFFDVLRIDHFRGFESYYGIPVNAKNVRNGIWKKGPGLNFFNQLNKEIGQQNIIAEDLGFITNDVKKLLADIGYPGMKVLQFAFDSRCEEKESKIYLPHNYNQNSIAYIGTHDNDTLCGWINNAPDKDIKKAMAYFNIKNKSSLHGAFIQTVLSSVCNTCILSMQDILKLGTSTRINIPSTVLNTNWSWRLTQEQLCKIDTKQLKAQVSLYNR